MIILQIYVFGVVFLEAKGDAPVAGDPHTPLPLPVTSEGVKPVSGNIGFFNRLGGVQDRENFADTPAHIGADAAFVTVLVELF